MKNNIHINSAVWRSFDQHKERLPKEALGRLLSEEEQFQCLWSDLSRKERVVVADLELLAGYKKYMTMEHIVSILKRADVGMGVCRLDELNQLLNEKIDQHLRHGLLLLDIPYEVSNYWMGTDNSSFVLMFDY